MTDASPAGPEITRVEDLIGSVAANVRSLRARHGWSLAEAASRAKLGKSTLAQVESGVTNPSLETLWAISTAFGVPVSTVIGPAKKSSRVIRHGEGIRVGSEGHDYSISLLLALGTVRGLEVSELATEPGPVRVSDPHLGGSVEHVYVMAGRARIGPLGDESEVDAGDFVSFASDVAHSYETLEPRTRCLVFMVYH